jgi:hypothetical protein
MCTSSLQRAMDTGRKDHFGSSVVFQPNCKLQVISWDVTLVNQSLLLAMFVC